MADGEWKWVLVFSAGLLVGLAIMLVLRLMRPLNYTVSTEIVRDEAGRPIHIREEFRYVP